VHFWRPDGLRSPGDSAQCRYPGHRVVWRRLQAAGTFGARPARQDRYLSGVTPDSPQSPVAKADHFGLLATAVEPSCGVQHSVSSADAPPRDGSA